MANADVGCDLPGQLAPGIGNAEIGLDDVRLGRAGFADGSGRCLGIEAVS